MLLISVATTSWAVDNSIYIDQSGDNAVIEMIQDGAGNRVRGVQGVGSGDTTPAKIKGDGVLVTIDQAGAGNILNLGIDSGTASGGAPTNVQYRVTGNDAVATINLNNNGEGTNLSTLVTITQDGDGAQAGVNILGTSNTLDVSQAGGANNKINATINTTGVVATVNQTGGGGNETTLNLSGEKGSVNLTTVGATNITNITQSGGGALGHAATINLNGSGNTTTLVQSGSIDTTVNLQGVGSGNTYNITTGN